MEAISLIKHDEGLRLKPYLCPANKLTIGYGRNIDDNGISEEEAEYLLLNDVENAERELTNTFSFYTSLSEVRKAVLLNMVFNMGLSKLLGFKKMIAALQQSNYPLAAQEMLDSNAARQLVKRYTRLYQMMLFDKWPVL